MGARGESQEAGNAIYTPNPTRSPLPQRSGNALDPLWNLPCITTSSCAELGESPVWNAEHEALRFVDAHALAVHRDDVASEAPETWPMPEPVSATTAARLSILFLAIRRARRFRD